MVGGDLLGIDAVSPTDVWAAGQDGQNNMLVDHWDGTRWTIVWTGPKGSLYSIRELSPTDVWASGRDQHNAFTVVFNGHAWTPEPPGISASSASYMVEVAPINKADVWGAGLVNSDPGSSFLVQWNGSSWSANQSPVVDNSVLRAVAAAPDHSVFAGGETVHGTTHSALIMKWSDTGWQVLPTGLPPTEFDQIHGLDPIAANDVWAIGFETFRDPFTTQGYALHFDGRLWTRFNMPNAPDGIRPRHVAALAPNDVWAVGDAGDAVYPNDPTRWTSVIEHWDGAAWTRVAAPASQGRLFGLSASASSGELWAVGYGPTIEHFCRP